MTDPGGKTRLRRINVLLVEDDEGDIVLTERALEGEAYVPTMHVVKDGVEAMWFLKQLGEYAEAPRPDLILLDLNMPRKDGREVLAEIKRDPKLCSIPVVVLTTSDSDQDRQDMYNQHANCYVTKPVALRDFMGIVKEIRKFWTTVADLPPQ